MQTYYNDKNLNSKFMNDFLAFLSSYNTIIILALIPFFAIATKLSFRKWGDNYYEHIVMNAYILSFYTLINLIIVYPLMLIFKNDTAIFNITGFTMLMIPFLLVWFFKAVYAEKPLKSIIGRVLLIVLFTLLGYILLTMLAMLVGFHYSILTGPESLDYIKPQQ